MDAKAPAGLTKRLSSAERRDVETWWDDLAPTERGSLRRDVGRGPRGVVARFVEAGTEADDVGATDFYEYLVNHEIFLEDGRPFHICSSHPAARARLAAGLIPAGFRCPKGDAACPMRALADAAGGRDVLLHRIVDVSRDEVGAHE